MLKFIKKCMSAINFSLNSCVTALFFTNIGKYNDFRPINMLYKYYINSFIICFLLCLSFSVEAQQDGKLLFGEEKQDSVPPMLIVRDTLPPVPDSLSFVQRPQQNLQRTATKIQYSSDSLDVPVDYNATDSMTYDLANQRIHLYGEAQVEYDKMSLKADYIIFDISNDIVIASSRRKGKVEFVDGDQAFESDSIKYNFRSHKGKVYEVRTEEGDGYLLSSDVKFDLRSQHSGEEDDVVYAQGTLYTTCDHPEPHFGIRSRKAKIIPDKVIVVGSSNLEIENVPTPLWLPFGFFPLNTGRRSGVIFSQDYRFSQTLGYSLHGFGYYHVINDYIDIRTTADIYTRGSWRLDLSSGYKKRYKYNGNLSIGYSHQRLDIKEIEPVPTRDFNIRWSHSQAASAHPTRTFSASVNLGTGSYGSNNFNDAGNVLRGNLSSNVSVRKRFPGKPYSLSASFAHSQNITNRQMTITFPEFNFNLNTINPFERKNKIGKERWYEKVTFGYRTNAKGIAKTLDTLIFKPDAFDEVNFGIDHNPNVGMNFRVLKYFNVNPSVRYREKWYFKTRQFSFDSTTVVNTEYVTDENGEIIIDPITGDSLISNSEILYGTIDTTFRYGFDAVREVSGGVSVNTTLYGTLPLGKKGQAIRHVMTPDASISVSPNYRKEFWGYYDSLQVDNRDEYDKVSYSRFTGGVHGGPPSGNGGASMSYGISNRLEGKFLNKKDTTSRHKKIVLINSLRISSGYNFKAEEFKMSNIRMSGNTKLFKVVDMNFGANFDPYARDDETGQRLNTYQWKAARRLARFTNANLTLTTRLDPRDISELFGKNKDKKESGRQSSRQFISSLSFSYSFNISKQFVGEGRDSIVITRNNLELSRTRFNLTEKWRMDLGRIGYDFVSKSLTYPDLSLYRDLHCWESGFSWQPRRRTFSFFLRVKPGTLDFLKLPYNRNRVDPFEF